MKKLTLALMLLALPFQAIASKWSDRLEAIDGQYFERLLQINSDSRSQEDTWYKPLLKITSGSTLQKDQCQELKNACIVTLEQMLSTERNKIRAESKKNVTQEDSPEYTDIKNRCENLKKELEYLTQRYESFFKILQKCKNITQ